MDRVYISGQITGNKNFVKEFEKREKELKSLGYFPVNPVAIYSRLKISLGREPTYREIMDEDIRVLKRCDYINFLDNWNKSMGAKEERSVAVKNNIPELKIKALSNRW